MPAIELGLVDGNDLADEHIDVIEQPSKPPAQQAPSGEPSPIAPTG